MANICLRMSKCSTLNTIPEFAYFDVILLAEEFKFVMPVRHRCHRFWAHTYLAIQFMPTRIFWWSVFNTSIVFSVDFALRPMPPHTWIVFTNTSVISNSKSFRWIRTKCNRKIAVFCRLLSLWHVLHAIRNPVLRNAHSNENSCGVEKSCKISETTLQSAAIANVIENENCGASYISMWCRGR